VGGEEKKGKEKGKGRALPRSCSPVPSQFIIGKEKKGAREGGEGGRGGKEKGGGGGANEPIDQAFLYSLSVSYLVSSEK